MPELKNTHPADVLASLRKNGTSLTVVAKGMKKHPSTVSHALRRCIPSANRAIAKMLKTSPHNLWPEWFDAMGKRRDLPVAPSEHKASAAKSPKLETLLDGGDEQ